MTEKTIPEKDLISYKKQVKAKIDKLETENNTLKAQVAQAESQAKTLKANLTDDEEVKKVREHLLAEDERLKGELEKLGEKEKAVQERERTAKAQELAAELKAKGLEITSDSLLEAEDMEKESNKLYVKFLADENEKLKKEPSNPSESVFEKGAGGLLRKAVWDKTEEEFETDWNKQKREALSRK